MPGLRPARHLDHKITTGRSGAFVRPTATTVVRREQTFVFEIKQGLEIRIRLQHHGSTVTTIATGGPTSWDIFFTPERGDPITTAATPRCDPRLIDELHGANRRPEFSTLNSDR